MSVHYKFKSALDYDTLAFDGLHITVGEVKAAISQQKRIGKSSDFDLQITNAQTKEVYVDDGALIPKNTSLLVARVPLAQQPRKQWHGDAANTAGKRQDGGVHAPGPADLSRMEGSEQDKISAMISQSTLDYDPSNYQRIRGQNQRGEVPPHYRCNRCARPGHWIKNCPISNIAGVEPADIRRSTGIPQSFMVPVDGPKAPGAMMTPTGSFAVPAVDHEAYRASETGGGEPAPASERRDIPDDLICSLCRDLLTDAVMIPCCGNSFCDECIRGALLESEDHECPDCREKEISPTTLIPNRFLRNSVASFRNQTGYSRRAPHRPSAPPPAPPAAEAPPPTATQPPPNGPAQAGQPIAVSTGVGGAAAAGAGGGAGEESDGSGEDNITVTVPPPSGGYPARHRARRAYPDRPPHADRPHPDRPQGDRPHGDRPHGDRPHGDRPHGDRSHGDRPYGDRPYGDRPYGDRPHSDRPHADRYGGPHVGQPSDRDRMSSTPMVGHVLEEQRAGTPTVDERRETNNQQMMYGRPPMFMHGPPPNFVGGAVRNMGYGPPYARNAFPPEPYQPPPPGIKESPTLRHGEDPLEAFNRMIREKEERAKRRETERRRLHSPSPRSPPRSPLRSPPRSMPRSPLRSPPPRSPPLRSPQPRVRSPPPPRVRSRSPPPPRVRSRSPRTRSRSPPPPRVRSRSPPPPRVRSRSPPPRPRTPPSRSTSRVRYSRSRSGSRGRVRRSPPWSPRRRPPPRERTLSLTRSPSPRRRRTPPRYRSPLRSPPRGRSPPPRAAPRTPPPHRRGYPGSYEDRASPHRRNVEPPFGARYGVRNNGGPPPFPPNAKGMPPGGEPPMRKESSPAFRGRYEEPFEEIPPGADPPVPGYEPPPFDNPALTAAPDLDRLPPSFHRAPYADAPPLYRDLAPPHKDLPPQYRDGFRGPPGSQPPYREPGLGAPPYREPGLGNPPYRDGPPFRDRQMPPQQFRDQNANPNYRGGPPPGFRDDGPPPGYGGPPVQLLGYRETGPPPGYRDDAPHGFREGPPVPFRQPNLRDAPPGPLMYRDPLIREPLTREPLMREGFRDVPEGLGGRDQMRGGFRHGNRNARGGRRNFDQDRQRERQERDARYNERDNSDNRRGRDDRNRDYDRNREVFDKERDRDNDRATPDRKRKSSTERTPPRRGRVVDGRDKINSESRGRSKDRESRRDKKDERERDMSIETKAKEQKEKNRKEKERKKKKKDKEAEKKKKREKRDKKEKDGVKMEGDDVDTEKIPISAIKEEPGVPGELEKPTDESEMQPEENSKIDNDLYGDIGSDVIVDKKIIETYVKMEPDETITKEVKEPANEEKDSSFEGLELQATGDELDLKTDNKEVLAPVPELSKWEMDEEQNERSGREPGEISPETENAGKVTSEVIKRAENAIFAKAINSIKTIEIKKISTDRLKLYSDDSGERKDPPINNLQITVPVTNVEQRSIELTNDKKLKRSKTPQHPKLSVKDRLGGKIEDPIRNRDDRFPHSTIERMKSRSKTPKREHPYRRVTVDTRDRARRIGGKMDEVPDTQMYDRRDERRLVANAISRAESSLRRPDNPANVRSGHSPSKEKAKKKEHKIKKTKEEKQKVDKHIESKGEKSKEEKISQPRAERDRKRSTLDEANFEPDYDEHVESDDGKEEATKKRDRSTTPVGLAEGAAKKTKIGEDGTIIKKPETGTDSSSGSDSSTSSSSLEVRKKKRKKKKSKRKKRKAASESESDSDGSSSDEPKKKKKRSKHKKKSSKKKKKKSKHK